ncbi:Telomere length and silencing protein [Gracilaria domingensis]|nr:Telomere length and silencing protein [Gracilaria domingensis]
MASSEPSLEQHAQEKADKSSSEEQASESNPAPVFRARKRSQKARKKPSIEKEELDVGEDERISKNDLLLIKEAQAMREKTRVAALDISATGRKSKSNTQKAEPENDSCDNLTTIGLRNNFAVERSNNVMDEHMNKYIEEGIRKKFGDQEGNGNLSNSNELKEENLYAIPEHLKVEERLQYDPGEGMPVAGVEEVELPEQVRRKKEMETLRAREKLHNASIMGDWTMGTNSTYPKNVQPSYKTGNSRDQNTRLEEENHHQTSQTLRDVNVDGKKRRFKHATDNLVADRFRKRWRR